MPYSVDSTMAITDTKLTVNKATEVKHSLYNEHPTSEVEIMLTIWSNWEISGTNICKSADWFRYFLNTISIYKDSESFINIIFDVLKVIALKITIRK